MDQEMFLPISPLKGNYKNPTSKFGFWNPTLTSNQLAQPYS